MARLEPRAHIPNCFTSQHKRAGEVDSTGPDFPVRTPRLTGVLTLAVGIELVSHLAPNLLVCHTHAAASVAPSSGH